MAEWRTGRTLGVTLYRDEVFVGHVCSAIVAAEIVETMNARRRSLAPAECGCPVTLSSVRMTSHTRECSDRRAAERLAADLEADADGGDAPEPGDAQRRSEATPQNDLPGEAVECICGRRIGTGRSGRFAGHDDPATGETCAGSYQTPQGAGLGAKVLDRLGIDPYDTTKGFTPKNGEHPNP